MPLCVQVTNFVDSTSGLPGANDNLYYLSYFARSHFGGTGPLQTNSGGQVSTAFEAVDVEGGVRSVQGSTNVVGAMNDLKAAFAAGGFLPHCVPVPVTPSGIH